MSNEGFNTFVLGQPPATSAAAGDSIPLIQGGGTKKASVSTITAYNVVEPTGGDDTGMLNSAFSGAASRPVFLSFGTYNVSAALTMPDYGVVVGEEINAWDFYNGVRPRTLLQANPANAFPSNTAILTLGNYNHIRGFTIFGLKNFDAGTTISGIAVPNKAFVTIEDIWVNLCYNGIDLTSDGVLRGSPWGANNIGVRIYGGGVLYNSNIGLLAVSTGGYVSDSHFSNIQVVSNSFAGMYLSSGVASCQILNCRVEDQPVGIWLKTSSNLLFNGCIFDRNRSPVIIDSCSAVTVTGCNSSAGPGSGNEGTSTHVQFSSTYLKNQGVAFSGNTYKQGAAATSYAYGVDAGAAVTGYFAETGTPDFNTAVFQDAYSQSIIAPLMVKLGP